MDFEVDWPSSPLRTCSLPFIHRSREPHIYVFCFCEKSYVLRRSCCKV